MELTTRQKYERSLQFFQSSVLVPRYWFLGTGFSVLAGALDLQNFVGHVGTVAETFRLRIESLVLQPMKNYQFTAHIERDHETGFYVGYIPSLPGAHSQAESLDALYQNLEEVAQLCIEELSEEELKHFQNEFVGTQEIRVAV